MGIIEINGNNKEFTNPSGKKLAEQTRGNEAAHREFKFDAELLETSEATPIKKFHNLS